MIEDLDHAAPALAGFCCAYTPQALLHAFGFCPIRLLPQDDTPDAAGSWLHDNLCPHVKKIVDRALARELPPLNLMVIVQSCDAMRRLGDAWSSLFPDMPLLLLDLPTARDDYALGYWSQELLRLQTELSMVTDRQISDQILQESIVKYDHLAQLLSTLKTAILQGKLSGGYARWQHFINLSGSQPVELTVAHIEKELSGTNPLARSLKGVPVFVFGNVLADPQIYALLEECGARVVGDDVCTGSRQVVPHAASCGSAIETLARSLLFRPVCARSLDTGNPQLFEEQILSFVSQSGARAVIGHVMKFCDPYLIRMPRVRKKCKEAQLPFLLLEGDCTLRSLGQHRTRIEAFMEALEHES